MNWLTRQEQFVLATVLTLLLVGLAVKTYRTAHPATAVAASGAAELPEAPESAR